MSNSPAWEQKLRAMVKYYAACQQAGNTRKFLDRYPVTHANGDVDPEVRDKLKQIGGESIAEHKDGADEIQNLTEELKNDPNPDKPQWEERVNQKREELKRKSNEILDQKTDEAIDYIYTLPDQERETAADFWKTILAGFIQFWADAWDWIVTMVKAITDWIADMWETIKASFRQVGKAFESAWEWLKNLF
ncbi:hypothetical protein Q9L58_000365 [Maublancomyces gigas]|uniref:Uncharacterized protein n=1 Tax=Discina gigas TaxID=1032678 RepID=A0ABR3GXP1_9PEZI